MRIYADTSFLVSLYLQDRHSEETAKIVKSVADLRGQRPEMWLIPLHWAEWVHAVEQHVFRGAISRREADELHSQFEQDRADRVWTEVAFPDEAFEICTQLARRHAARLGTRTMDALHVGAAMVLGADAFWTFDRRQADLARAEGLKTQLSARRSDAGASSR